MHNGGRLGNQLWWIAAFYAYCLEKGYVLDMRCFFEYQEYFNCRVESFWARPIGKLYYFLEYIGLPENVRRELFYSFYIVWMKFFGLFKKKYIVYDSESKQQDTFKVFLYKIYKSPFVVTLNFVKHILGVKEEPAYDYSTTHNPVITLLPPSTEDDLVRGEYTYFNGWLFRNPAGILKYQKEISVFFTPKKRFEVKVNDYINDLRKKYKHIVGVHVRLGDVVNAFMNNDRIAYSEVEVVNILNEYLHYSKLSSQETCFVICSDGKIDESFFKGLHIKITKNNPIEDLRLLSKTDTIIGADSSFAVMASLLGDVTFIVFKRGIDWDYYKDKKGFFVNKYVKRFIY